MQTVLTPPIFTNYGPLATQYLTGGQMGYMPQAQYLTPAEYGAFRTLPGPTPTGYQNQMPGLLQSWMIRNYGAPFGLPKYTFNTYNPAVNQQQYMSCCQCAGQYDPFEIHRFMKHTRHKKHK